MFEQTVVRAFDDGQAEIARMAQRIEPRALLDGLGIQREKSCGPALRAQHRQIVNHVDAEHRRRVPLASNVGNLDAIALGGMNQF